VDHEEGVVAVTKELVSLRGKPWRELEFFPQVTAVRWISWGGASYTKLRWHRDVQPLGIQHSSVALAPREPGKRPMCVAMEFDPTDLCDRTRHHMIANPKRSALRNVAVH
jgi:hypothetical protein